MCRASTSRNSIPLFYPTTYRLASTNLYSSSYKCPRYSPGMKWTRLGILLLGLAVYSTALVVPEWCEGNVACCIFGRCEDCDCHLCIIAGGQPHGPNSTCADDCVCEEPPPPVCTNATLCDVAFFRCMAVPECADCFVNYTSNEFCRFISRLIRRTGDTASEICACPSSLTNWLRYIGRLHCPTCEPPSCPPTPSPPCPTPTPCPPNLPCPPDDQSIEFLLAILLLGVTSLLLVVCLVGAGRPRRQRHYGQMHYVDGGDTAQIYQSQ